MRYTLEFLKENQVVSRHTGDESLLTARLAHMLGISMLETMTADLGATSFRVLDENGKIVTST